MEGYNIRDSVVFHCQYHIIWCSKYKRKVITESISARLGEVLKEACQLLEAEIVELDIRVDHVRVTIGLAPQKGVHLAVKLMKGYSSKILREEYPELKKKLPTLWTNAYFVTTKEKYKEADVENFIASQSNTWRKH